MERTTPKQLAKRRLAKNKIKKISLDEGSLSNKENERPQNISNIKKSVYKVHDRQVKDMSPFNPFDISNHQRVFTRQRSTRTVQPIPFIMSDPHTICDVDPTFYKIIEGRPLRQFTDVKVYMGNIRDITLFRANAAYLKDQIIQIDTSFVFELEQYTKVNNFYVKCKANFVTFAKESYDNAKKIQMLAEEKSLELASMSERLEAYSFEYVKLRNQLCNVMFSYDTLSWYRKFLDSLSPEHWQEIHGVKFTNVGDVASSSVASIDAYKVSVSMFSKMPPRLYFKRPQQLILIYDDLSRQCLNYMAIDVITKSILKSILKSRDYLKLQFTNEIDEMKDIIGRCESYLMFMEEKELEYKTIFERLLMNEFQRLYASFETSKLFTCVQYVNTRIFGGSEDPKDDICLLMKQMELLYLELTSDLDCLNQEVVKKSTNELFAQDIRVMKEANMAKRIIKECDILKKALYTSFEPPKLKWRQMKK